MKHSLAGATTKFPVVATESATHHHSQETQEACAHLLWLDEHHGAHRLHHQLHHRGGALHALDLGDVALGERVQGRQRALKQRHGHGQVALALVLQLRGTHSLFTTQWSGTKGTQWTQAGRRSYDHPVLNLATSRVLGCQGMERCGSEKSLPPLSCCCAVDDSVPYPH